MKRSRVDIIPRKKSSPGKIKSLLTPDDIILKKGPSKICLKKIKIKSKEMNKSKEIKKSVITKTHKSSLSKLSNS